MSKDTAYWDLGDQKPTNLQAEFGSEGKVRFLNQENTRMYDSEGEVILCKCGKPAGSAAMGNGAMIAWCSDCSPMNKESAELVYRAPTEAQKQKLIDLGFVIPEQI